MTTWTTPCDTSSCVQTRTVGDRVEIRDTEYPEVVLSVPAEAWEAHEAAIEARGYRKAIADLRAEGRRALERAAESGFVDTEDDGGKWDAYDAAAEFLEDEIEEGERD